MVSKTLYSSSKGDWGTPDDLFARLHRRFRFNVDAAASESNALLKRWFGEGGVESCGLLASWKGRRVFCNPPYGRKIGAWTLKAAEREADVAVLLLPARTCTRWFHRDIYQRPGIEIEFVRGRLTFKGAPHGAPFPSMLAIFWGRDG